MFRRPVFRTLLRRLCEPRRFIQVLAGPRQTGKTTLAQQVLEALHRPSHYASADGLAPRDVTWLEQQWEAARLLARSDEAILVVDEIQKVQWWAETVKRLWDEDTRNRVSLKVLLLGSSPLLVQKGLAESLAGRFELVRITHWSFSEMSEAFGFDLDQFLCFGGYPGAVPLIGDEARWAAYIRDSLMETTVSRDILLLTRVDKPILLRQLFELACSYSGQVLSFQEMLGQLQERGNTTTLAHYLELLGGAGLVTGLQKYSVRPVRQRASSPKLLVLNNALMTALSEKSFAVARADADYWGRLVETAVGAHLVNGLLGTRGRVFYWRRNGMEVDYVVSLGDKLLAVEVKSGRRRDALPGLSAFRRQFKVDRTLLIGGDGIPLEQFLQLPPVQLFE